MSKIYSLSDLANSLATASKIANELQIDISSTGTWRKVIISNTLGHTLTKDIADPLIDAKKDEVNYGYLAAHYGKRAQVYLSPKTPRKSKHTFIIAFFSAEDSSKILSMWSCKPDIFWEEVRKQEARFKKSKSSTFIAYFSEKWLKLRKGKGSELIFKSENI